MFYDQTIEKQNEWECECKEEGEKKRNKLHNVKVPRRSCPTLFAFIFFFLHSIWLQVLQYEWNYKQHGVKQQMI